jgi:hypothetical protein
MEFLHQMDSVQLGKEIKAASPAFVKKTDLPVRFGRVNIPPIDFKSQGINQLHLLEFPDGKGMVLGRNPILHLRRPWLADIKFNQGAGIEIKLKCFSNCQTKGICIRDSP